MGESQIWVHPQLRQVRSDNSPPISESPVPLIEDPLRQPFPPAETLPHQRLSSTGCNNGPSRHHRGDCRRHEDKPTAALPTASSPPMRVPTVSAWDPPPRTFPPTNACSVSTYPALEIGTAAARQDVPFKVAGGRTRRVRSTTGCRLVRLVCLGLVSCRPLDRSITTRRLHRDRGDGRSMEESLTTRGIPRRRLTSISLDSRRLWELIGAARCLASTVPRSRSVLCCPEVQARARSLKRGCGTTLVEVRIGFLDM
jgi:hypothetical protein